MKKLIILLPLLLVSCDKHKSPLSYNFETVQQTIMIAEIDSKPVLIISAGLATNETRLLLDINKTNFTWAIRRMVEVNGETK